jgi:hypothetical protein
VRLWTSPQKARAIISVWHSRQSRGADPSSKILWSRFAFPIRPSGRAPCHAVVYHRLVLRALALLSTASAGGGVVQPISGLFVAPTWNSEVYGGRHTLAGADGDVLVRAVGVMHGGGVGRSTGDNRQAQGRNRTHRSCSNRLSTALRYHRPYTQPKRPPAFHGRQARKGELERFNESALGDSPAIQEVVLASMNPKL